MKISFVLNGEPSSAEDGLTVAALIARLELKASRIGVEINQSVVPKATFDRTAVREGDKVEIINFVGGG